MDAVCFEFPAVDESSSDLTEGEGEVERVTDVLAAVQDLLQRIVGKHGDRDSA